MAVASVEHVVIMVQENHTTDNYFRGLAPYGANVAHDWPLAANPPTHDQPHSRQAYYEWLTRAKTGEHSQFDTAAVLPFYLYLALTGAFLENHCAGFGTNSTANHLLIVGGQSPTLRNPPRGASQPVWDLPSLPGLAGDHGISWNVYTAASDYPVAYYKQLQGSAQVRRSSAFVTDVQANKLPALSYLWHDPPLDEHPPANVTQGMDAVRQAVDAVVAQGLWESTVFMLTWDDWGGYDDHVATPVTEYTPDNVQLAYGPRVPLLVFGGRVKPGIDSRWCSHVSVPKTALQLLGLPALGVPRLDDDQGLADLVDPAVSNPAPPPHPQKLPIPPPPGKPPTPHPLPPAPAAAPIPVPPIVQRDGSTLAPPDDAPLPKQPSPPHNS